jgi:glyoxylase I family protein
MLSPLPTLDQVVLICANLDETRRFYQDVIGFPVIRDLGPSGVELLAGPSILTLRPRGRDYDGTAPAPDAASVQLAFRMERDAIDASHEVFRERRVPVLEPPADQRSGRRTLFVADPEANVVEIFSDL